MIGVIAVLGVGVIGVVNNSSSKQQQQQEQQKQHNQKQQQGVSPVPLWLSRGVHGVEAYTE